MLEYQRITLINIATAIIFCGLLCNLNLFAQAQTAATNVEDLVKSISGGKLKIETKAGPYQLVGDFDGDKIKDIAVIVSLSDSAANIRKTVKIENPYAASWGNEIDEKLLALFIIHGRGKGWQFAQKSVVLLLGRNSALIFQKQRLGELTQGMEISKSKLGKLSIIFPTEASEGILKWNGKRYTWRETEP